MYQQRYLTGVAVLVFHFLIFTYPFASWANEKNMRFHTTEEKIILPLVNTPPKIDGIFDTEIYSKFLKLGNFFQRQPRYNQPATEKSEIFLAFDNKNLYLAFKAYTHDPGKIRASVCRRESFDNDDYIEILLDPFLTKMRGVLLTVNPYGVQMDGLWDEISGDGSADISWDTLFYSRGNIYDWGYLVEVKIPFKSLRFPRKKEFQEWGFNVCRFIADTLEYDSLFFHDRKNRSWVGQSGRMIINSTLKPGLHMELIPYLSALKNKGENMEPEAGLSFKYSLSSDITLDLTYNPDFSHIEADAGQIDVNQRYALYFEEKRPFFLEGKEIFSTPIELFYSRRIASPRFGAKVTGRLGKSTFGVLSAFDNASFANLSNVSGGGEQDALTNLFRYKYNLGGDSYLGIFISDKRWKDNGFNNVIGVDSHLRYKNFRGNFQVAVSNNSNETGSTGEAYYGNITFAEENLYAGVSTTHFSTDFDAQLGFIKRLDIKSYYGYLGYNLFPEKKYFISGGPRLSYEYITDWQGNLQDKKLQLRFTFQTLFNTAAAAYLMKDYEKYNGIGFNKTQYRLSIYSSPSKFFNFGTYFILGDSIYYSDTPYLGHSLTANFWANILPTPRLSITTNWSAVNFYEGTGEDFVYRINIFRFSSTYLFTRNLYLKTIWEYNDYYNTHYGNVLLAFEYNPGTVFYLGYSTDLIRMNEELITQSYSIYVKLSYLLRK